MPNLPEQTANFSEQVENLVRIIKHGKREQALFVVGFLCLGLPAILPEAVIKLLPDFFQRLFSWLNVISIAPVLWGLVLVWKKATPRQIDFAATAKPSVIKGPFAFGEMDGEIFSQLGREADLGKLLGYVLDSQICLAALKGESGAGKTSLLRAGLAYTLAREKEKYGVTPIYWEAVPENAAAELLRTIHAICPEEKARLQKLDDLLDQASANKKVIIIDQAEQLSPEKHAPLFELFKKVAAQKPPYAVTWIIAFREEYASTWFDFEAATPDFLPPKQSLKIFSEAQARENIAVLAKAGGLAPDNSVIVEMVRAMSDQGKVSPVEIGVGMMVLSELDAGLGGEISLGKFQDAGGVTGLLRAYIKGKLEDGMPGHECSPMQAALLDLIDPEKSRQRLAQGKTAADLAKTAGLPLPRMLHNLRYLASPEARILEALPAPESETRYRLAHERLIPALESLAGEMLAAAEQAKRLLNERYRTWVKTKQRKFLLSGRELRDALKHRRHFAAAVSPELLRYLRQSNNARYLKMALGALCVLAMFSWQPLNVKVVEPMQRKQRLENLMAQFVAIEGGLFEMGDSSGLENETRHWVKLSGFSISKYEITNQQFCDFLNEVDSAKAQEWLDFSSVYSHIREKGGRFILLDEARKNEPVVTVSWFGAAAFCNFMSKREGKKFRLPTEAEWEYAARGGNQSKGYRYSGSDSLEAVAWYFENSAAGVHEVGKKQPNELGLYDMSGNVWEWCQDWYGGNYYETCKQSHPSGIENPQGPEGGSDRVLRGGSWDYDASICRSADRGGNNPVNRSHNIGFRLVFVP